MFGLHLLRRRYDELDLLMKIIYVLTFRLLVFFAVYVRVRNRLSWAYYQIVLYEEVNLFYTVNLVKLMLLKVENWRVNCSLSRNTSAYKMLEAVLLTGHTFVYILLANFIRTFQLFSGHSKILFWFEVLFKRNLGKPPWSRLYLFALPRNTPALIPALSNRSTPCQPLSTLY